MADINELDVYLSKDGEIAVLHDKDTKRTAGLDRPVVAQTLAELRTLDAGSWKAAKWAGEKIPTLAEVIAATPAGKRLFIEIKCGPEILPKLKEVLQASGKGDEHFEVIAFNYEVMQKAKELMPKLAMHWLVSPKKDKATGITTIPPLDDLIAKAKAAKLDGLNLNKDFPIDAAFTEKIRAAGLKFYVWTVNDAAEARKLVAAGVDGIATDRAGWLRDQLAH
jgi:glycerophosphoryl diester phosphodiesterase